MVEETQIAAQVERLLAQPIAEAGYRLLEVQYRQERGWVLRLLVDGEQGVNVDACSAISELAGRILDVEDPVPQGYTLEVSSPGVFRALRERRHFEQSLGRLARMSLAAGYMPEFKQRTLRGVIAAVEDDTVMLEQDGQRLALPLDGIRNARLDPDL